MGIPVQSRRTFASYFVALIILLFGCGVIGLIYWQNISEEKKRKDAADAEISETNRVMEEHKEMARQLVEQREYWDEVNADLKAELEGRLSSQQVADRREKRDQERKEKQQEREDERRHQEMLQAIRESKK